MGRASGAWAKVRLSITFPISSRLPITLTVPSITSTDRPAAKAGLPGMEADVVRYRGRLEMPGGRGGKGFEQRKRRVI